MTQAEQTPTRNRLILRASCPQCRHVDVPVRNIHLWSDAKGDFLSFICPSCSSLVRERARKETVDLLRAAAPPITEDDVRTFVTDFDWASLESADRRATDGRGALRRAGAALAGAFRGVASQRHRMLSS